MSFPPIKSLSSRYAQCIVATSSYEEVKIGQKSNSVMSQGIVWAPYIMACSSTIIADPQSNRIRKLNKIIESIENGQCIPK